MKVLLVNGSPHQKGSVYTALSEVGKTLNEAGIEIEYFQIGTQQISGCIACGRCFELKKCVFDDIVNEFVEKAKLADGFVFGSPVYYASMNGTLSSFMDRVFYSGNHSGAFAFKPAASVVNARRGGNTATFDQMNKYYTLSQMPIISSTYWNMTHGFTPDDVRQDLEGLQTMRALGRNMAWFLNCKEIGMKNGVKYPEQEERIGTHFIR